MPSAILIGALLAVPAWAASYRRTVTIGDAVGTVESGFGRPLAATADGALLVGTGGANDAGSAQLFDAGTGALLRVFTSPLPPALSSSLAAAVGAAGSDVLAGEPQFPVGDVSAGGAFVGAVHRFDGTTRALLHTFLSPTPTANAGFGGRLVVHGSDLFVVEGGAVDRFDLGTQAFVVRVPAPAGSVSFGAALLALDGLLIVGDADANRVTAFDVATGAIVRTFVHPVAGEAARFGAALGLVDGDLLVGAPRAAPGGAVYRIALADGTVKTTYESPAPAAGGFGAAVGTFGNAVVAGDSSFSLLEDGVFDGAAFVFDAGSARLVAILGRGNLDHFDAFGASLLAVGDQLFAGAPDEDVNTVTGFRLDCGGATSCTAADAGLSQTQVDVDASRVVIRARFDATPAELAGFQSGSICLYGSPSPALRCTPFSCSGSARRLDCGAVSIVRHRGGRSSLVARITGFVGPLPAAGPLAVRLNGGPLTQQYDGTTTRAAALSQCRHRGSRLRCR